ncbi:MAG: rplM [Alphaproteobacteria bacterium]|nr:rplM [Alphaproteobacteria bacterium]
MLHNQTKSIREQDVEKKWFLFDAKDVVVGRLASEIAKILRGKHKPIYTPHVDCGDFVIVINAGQVHLTGNKLTQDFHRWHTGFPGGLKERSMGQLLDGKHPERVVENAVQRMMPKTKLGSRQFTKLRVYAGAEHPHEAQQATTIDFAAQNAKNTKRG